MADHMEGMDEDLYGEDKPHMAEKSVDEQESDSPTAMIPKSLLAGKKFDPGDEVVLEVVSMHGDEVMVKYASEKPDKAEGDTKPDMSEDDEMEQMNKSY